MFGSTFPPFVELRNQPEFLPLMSRDRTHWPRCLLWHGWLPGLSSRALGTPWAVASSDLASSCLENALGPYPRCTSSAWHPFWDQDDVQDMVDDVPVAPNIWTDGSWEPIPHLDVEIAGAGAFVHSPAIIFDSNHWGHAQDLDDPHEGSSHIFSGIPGPIRSVQRAEYWGVILALQAYSGIHIGIDNMNVLRGVAALLSHGVPRSPLPLMKDGDLLTTIHSMLNLRGFATVKVSKVEGHATRAMVASGDVRLEDLVGNNGADTAADLGRLRQHDDVITARRDLLRVRRLWYPIMLDLHRLMVAISRIEVNHDGFVGTAPDAMILDKGSIAKTRAPSFRLIVDHASLPGPPHFLSSTWCTLDPLPITQDDVAAWPYSVDILLVSSSFLASLHWPQGTSDLGKFGISYFELLLMFEVCSGKRLQTEKTVRAHLRSRRPLVFSGFSVGIGQEIRHGCQFLHCLFRALGHLPGGLARFIPCQPSAHYARLSHLGWGRYGHGLSSRPRESCDHQFLTPLLNFFGYPDGAVTKLFNGTCKTPLFLHSLFKEISVMVGIYSPGLFTGGVGPGPGLSVHFPDHDPVLERPAKRFRITGKSSALRREPVSGEGLPTPKTMEKVSTSGYWCIED